MKKARSLSRAAELRKQRLGVMYEIRHQREACNVRELFIAKPSECPLPSDSTSTDSTCKSEPEAPLTLEEWCLLNGMMLTRRMTREEIRERWPDEPEAMGVV